MKSIILLFILLLLSQIVEAQTDRLKTVKNIGSQKDNVIYFRVSEGWDLNCLYDAMYFNNNTDFGKVSLSVILTAINTGKKLSRVDYIQDVSGRCNLSLVEVE